MGCDIHLFMEIDRGAGFELVSPLAVRIDEIRAGTEWDVPEEEAVKAAQSIALAEDLERHEVDRQFIDDETAFEDGLGVGRWQFHVSRNYRLFAVLAGVRNYDNATVPIAEARGLPADCSLQLREELDDSDLHSHSWLLLAEVLPRLTELDALGCPGFVSFIREKAKAYAGREDCVRFVFAFDN